MYNQRLKTLYWYQGPGDWVNINLGGNCSCDSKINDILATLGSLNTRISALENSSSSGGSSDTPDPQPDDSDDDGDNADSADDGE